MSISWIEEKIKGERDRISKHFIIKKYRLHNSMSAAYSIYYQTKLWRECILPLIKIWGIKKNKIKRHDMTDNYICPSCQEIKTLKQILPHHIKYIQLAKKWNYRGFDNRMLVNNPKNFEFICYNCHKKIHEYNSGV